MPPPESQRRPGRGAAQDALARDRAAEHSANPQKGKPRLRLIINPVMELEAARREYEGAQLGYYFDPDQQRVRRRINKAPCRLADARAAVARSGL